MVSQVTLGNFFSVGGKTVLGGAGGSGLDTQSLIKGLVEAKSQPATADQSKITANGAQTTALNTFQSLLSTFQSTVDALRNPPGVGNAASNVFKFTNASISNGGSAYVGVTAQPGAALQSYNISAITQLATAASQGSGTFTIANADAAIVSANPVSGSALQFAPGTVTVNGQPITFNEGDSLNTVAANFNAVSSQTGISATVIQIGSGQYQLSFNATKTGAASSFDLSSLATVSSDPSGVLSNIGLTEQQGSGTITVADADTDVVPPAAGTVGFQPGVITIGSQAITINGGDTLNIIASKFNAVASIPGGTGIQAHVVQASAGNFKLEFTATPGTPAFDLSNPSSVTDPDGVLGNLGFTAPKSGTMPTAGQDAHFSLNGIPLTRSSNNVSDAVNGVTFNLLQQTPDSVTNYTASIVPDTTTVQNTIVSFVSAYNALQSFAAQQTQLNSDGTYASTAVLANDLTFRQTMSNINQEVTSQVTGLANGAFSSLSDIGITFINQPATSTTPAVNNVLNVNDAQLSSALAANFKGVSNLFGFNMTSNNSNLTIFSETNALGLSNFTLNVDPANNIFTATYDNGSGPKTINMTGTNLGGTLGYTLTGLSGTVLDGMKLIYAATGPATIDVHMTQGIADRSYNSASGALKANTGTIAVALTALTTSNAKLNKDIDQINAQVAQYQDQLVRQFSALEAAISKVNTLLSSLTAQQNAALAGSGH